MTDYRELMRKACSDTLSDNSFDGVDGNTLRNDDGFIFNEREPPGIPSEVLKAAQRLGNNRLAFRRMLEAYVPRTGYVAPESSRILDIGCADCTEGHVLSSYFGGQPFGYQSEKVLVVGIDLDRKALERAELNYRIAEFSEDQIGPRMIPLPNYQFICGDAQQLTTLVKGEFDVVVARHPNIAEQKLVWKTIFQQAVSVMKPGSLFIATSFSDIEQKMLEETVEGLFFPYLSTPNRYAIPTTHPEVSIDRNVLLARKIIS